LGRPGIDSLSALTATFSLAAIAACSALGTEQGPVRVLILGDSISIGYTDAVRVSLGEEAVVVRPTREGGEKPENCAGTSYGVAHIGRWLSLGGGSFDVVHFNFGLHDLKRVNPETGANSVDPADPNQAPLEVYAQQLREITEELKASGAELIFATTTPVPEGGVRPHRDPADVVRYNQAALEIMGELDVAVNDLYGFALPQLGEVQKPVNVHFTRAGKQALAGEVVMSIRAVSPRLALPAR